MTENAARALLRRRCFADHGPFCPRCRESKLYTLADSRYRCSCCRYTFHEFSGRWINNGEHSCRDWIRLVELFVQGRSTHQAAGELGLSYNAAYKAFTTIRFAILAHALDADQFISDHTGLNEYVKNKKLTGIPGKNRLANIPVYGILEKNGVVFIDLVQGIHAETVIYYFVQNFCLGVTRNGNILHTDRYRHYDALILCGDESLPLEYVLESTGKVAIDAQQHPFWSFAQERIKRFKGISIRRFPLYLKELEFRYNNRHSEILDPVLTHLCDLVPDFE
jgi:transposase